MIQLVLLTLLPAAALGEEYCLARDNNPYLMFGEKTTYEFIYGRNPDTRVPNCHPIQFWFVTRYGASLPLEEQMQKFSHMKNLRDQIMTNHDERRNGELCRQDLNNLRQWTISHDLEMSNKLSEQGYTDMMFLGKRLRSIFRDLLDATYTQDRFIMKYAQSERAEESAKALAEGMFGRGAVDISPDDEYTELLEPEKNCTWWEKEDANRDKSEENKFKKSEMVKSLVGRVSRRLGFLYNLTFESLLDMWEVCRYEKAISYDVPSPWCAAFLPDDLKIMDYFDDLRLYYSHGYGQKAMLKLGCPLLKDMMEHFNKLTKNTTDLEETPRGIFYTVHTTALSALLVRLGIGKPMKPLTSDYTPELERRQWRTSKMIPFSGNLAAVFYKCDNNQYNVMFFQNEKLYNYEGCKVGLCDWKFFNSKFRSIIDSSSCSSKFCEVGGAPSTKTHIWLLSIGFALWRTLD